jgi:two-component system CheB/CheR fusion protein
LPIDVFFTSLAEAQGPLSVGVVLSGTASDGAQGLKAIKEQGGIAFAQDEQTAKYSGMPRSAAATGATDFVLPPTEIAAGLARLSGHAYMSRRATDQVAEDAAEQDGSLKKIIALLHRGTHVNFAAYKQGTLRRRIGRRMIVRRCDTLAEYLEYLNTYPKNCRTSTRTF